MNNGLQRSGWKGTRSIQTWSMFIVGTVALFSGHIDGPTWMGLCALLAGIYNASEVGAKHAAAKAVVDIGRLPVD